MLLCGAPQSISGHCLIRLTCGRRSSCSLEKRPEMTGLAKHSTDKRETSEQVGGKQKRKHTELVTSLARTDLSSFHNHDQNIDEQVKCNSKTT